MNEIRFVHSDYWRLAESICGLADAPEWLRRLARDASRTAALRTIELAATRHVDFLFIGGSCTSDDRFQLSVADWLREPLQRLKNQGVQVAMAECDFGDVQDLADIVIPADHRLNIVRVGQCVRMSTSTVNTNVETDLTITPEHVAMNGSAKHNYVYRPQLRHEVNGKPGQPHVYSAGSTQAHSPVETGAFGCLLVGVDPDRQIIDAEFHATDSVRFETRTLDTNEATSTSGILNEIVRACRQIASQAVHTTVVDWQITQPIDISDISMVHHQLDTLSAVRERLQTGHLGVWPRRISMCSPRFSAERLSGQPAAQTLQTLLLQKTSDQRLHEPSTFEQLLTGARLLNKAA